MKNGRPRPTDPQNRRSRGCETPRWTLCRLSAIALVGLILVAAASPAYGFSTGYQKVLWVKLDNFGLWLRLANYNSPDSQCTNTLDYRLPDSDPLFEVKAAALLSATFADKKIALTSSTCSGPGTYDGMNILGRITILP
jgi:hypothetical protein